MISAIIVNYRSAELSKRAALSVLGENEPVEVFVVDNTASEEERTRLESLFQGDVSLIFNARNEGFARACNLAFKASKGEWIFLLNPDAYVLPGALSRLKSFLVANPRAAAAGPRIYWDDHRTFLLPPSTLPTGFREFANGMMNLSPAFRFLDTCIRRWRLLRAWRAVLPVRQKALSGGHMLLRRTAIEECGGLFDEEFFMYYEDSDLCLRLIHAGFRLYMEPKAEVIHNYVHSRPKMELLKKSRDIYFSKNFGSDPLLILSGKLPPAGNIHLPKGCTPLGEASFPIAFDIPRTLQKSWLFEWSPSPFFAPSVGCFGRGATMELPVSVRDMLGPGTYYARVSRPASVAFADACWSWEIGPAS